MKKSLFSFFVVWLALLVSSPWSFVFAEVSCSNFKTASYVVPGGKSGFLIGTPIPTDLVIKAKNQTTGGAENVEIVMIMDRSGSMEGKDGTSQTKIEAARQAMQALVNVLVEAGNPKNRIALVTFAGDATTNLAFTSDYTAMNVAVSKVVPTPGSGTSIGNGLYESGAVLKGSPLSANTRRLIILASDGVHNTGKSISSGKANVPSDVTVYTIGIGTPSYLDEPAMKDIAATAGAKDGEYYHSAVPELVTIFQSLTQKVIGSFKLKNVSLLFTRDDVVHTTFTGSSPAYSLYDSAKEIIRWNSLGDIGSGQQRNISINYEGAAVKNKIPLNTGSLEIRYTISGTPCAESVPVNVLFVDVSEIVIPGDECIDTTWSPPADSVCRPQSFTQVSNCGNTRSVKGTKLCTQCSDKIDNDSDGYIDYPADSWCFSLEDNSETDLHFLEF
ncbi:MAG: VWA domain-containing protein [Parcubacteria group bacterium]|nr:VWA domain-containing protein [Parcubacteria group bacterium]